MGSLRSGIRLFLFLIVVALPPLIVFAVLASTAPDWLERIGMGTALFVVALFAVIWAAVISVVGSRTGRDDVEAILDLAERGRAATPTSGGQDAREATRAYERLATALDERNRQIADLAAHVRTAPIAEDARTVARSVVGWAASVTHDPTWSLVVLRTPDPALLPAGTYAHDETQPGPLDDLHRWASTAPADDPSIPGVRHAVGPWGAFVIVEVAAGEDLRASLLAPWEGRDQPTRAERELLGLLGQNSATAVEHALLYARLRGQAEELNRMAAIQSDFLRSVTHDLQTPLTSIGAVAAELQEQPALEPAARADLETIAHQADRLRRMVSQLLVASRLEAGAVSPRTEIFRAEPLVQRTWEALRAERPFDLSVQGEPRLAVGDPDRFEQILWALLDNAVKYSPPGSPIRVELDSGSEGAGAEPVTEIRVIDEGSGLSKDDAEHAFEQFYRSAGARRMAPDGSGVGLYAARGLARAMGGDITLRSALGMGTTACVRLPAEAAVEEPAAST